MNIGEMVKKAVKDLGGKVSTFQIKEYIRNNFGDVNEGTINNWIRAYSVNNPKRINWSFNEKPRNANTKYDFLFLTGKGQIELYDPDIHGEWEIKEDEYGKLMVGQRGLEISEEGDESIEGNHELSFPIEAHLRDFIAKNISTLRINGQSLKLFKDESGREGVEYPTDVGQIDILAIDEKGNFVIFELKLSRGVDKALGQLLRYMGWIKVNLAKDKEVRGIIVAKEMDEKLKYGVVTNPKINLFEYELIFKIKEVKINV